jgi:carbon monoxide dehydrogenase subunit G
MELTGEYRIPAPREAVWKALNDPEILRAAIPGCEDLVKVSDTEFTATVTLKIGPVKARFGGKVTLSDLDPPKGYKITGEGQGGVAGFAKGGAEVRLDEVDGGSATLLTYKAQADVGGKLAQIGSRLIGAAAAKIADEFFASFAAAVAAGGEGAAAASEAAPPSPPAPTAAKGLVPAIWIAGLVAIVAVLLFIFLS